MSFANDSNFPTPYDVYAQRGEQQDNEKPEFYCCNCGAGIFADDYYYDIDGEPFCVNCVEEMRRTA